MELSSSDLYSAFDSPPDAIIGFLTWLANSSGPREEVRVADIGAGPGRLLPAFARLGWATTAYEPNLDFHATAARVARHAHGLTQVKLGGFEDIDEISTFDFVIAVNGPFAYLLTAAARSAALRATAQALRPGGHIVLDVPNFEWILSNYREPVPERRAVGGHQIELRREHVIDHDRRTFTTIDRYTITGAGPRKTVTQTHVYSMVPAAELTGALTETGFENIRDFGSFESRTPRISHGARLLLVASKWVPPGGPQHGSAPQPHR